MHRAQGTYDPDSMSFSFSAEQVLRQAPRGRRADGPRGVQDVRQYIYIYTHTHIYKCTFNPDSMSFSFTAEQVLRQAPRG